MPAALQCTVARRVPDSAAPARETVCLRENIATDMELPMRLPSLFLSHGAPTLALADSAAGRFLDGLAGLLPARPRAIVVASAHYMAPGPTLGAAPQPPTIHDFGGFPPALYQLRYPAPGAVDLAADVAGRLRAAGLPPQVDPRRGLDHGVWVPLLRAFPEADIPVLPLAVDPTRDASYHHRLGEALAPLRDDGVLLIGSGGFVHNLGDIDWQARDDRRTAWATDFADWMRERLLAGDRPALLDWQRQAPHARHAHPTVEHLMPLFVALGAGGAARELHHSTELGSLALDAFAFA